MEKILFFKHDLHTSHGLRMLLISCIVSDHVIFNTGTVFKIFFTVDRKGKTKDKYFINFIFSALMTSSSYIARTHLVIKTVIQ